MVSTYDIQKYYIELYKALREYLWDFKVVDHISNLEIQVYKTFPSLDDIRRALASVKLDAKSLIDDEDVNMAIKEFEEFLDSASSVYAKIIVVKEVVQE